VSFADTVSPDEKKREKVKKWLMLWARLAKSGYEVK